MVRFPGQIRCRESDFKNLRIHPFRKKRKRKRKVKIKKSFISNNEYPEWRTDYFLKIWRHSEFHETNRNRVKRTQVKLQRMRNMAKNR